MCFDKIKKKVINYINRVYIFDEIIESKMYYFPANYETPLKRTVLFRNRSMCATGTYNVHRIYSSN